MTDVQIENWRRVLSLTLGPYAFIMPKEEIQRLRDTMQKRVDNLTEKEIEELEKTEDEIDEVKECNCDPKMYGQTKHENETITCNKCKLNRK